MSDVPKHELSSGNVFRDLELPDADELQVKADLVYEISRTIEERGLSQRQAAKILRVDQPKVSALVRGQLKGFSIERLYRFLNALGKDVEIVIRPRESAGVHVRTGRAVAKMSRSRTAQRKP